MCHAESFFPPVYWNGLAAYNQVHTAEYLAFLLTDDASLTHIKEFSGPPPEAEDDFTTTPEETPVTINILANDRSGRDEDDKEEHDDDDDDDDRYEIDSNTVDLHPDQSGIQASFTTPQGTYSVNKTGDLTFAPSLNFFGNTSIQYTVKSEEEETSNRATIGITVNNINDAPVIVGARQLPIQAQAGKPTNLSVDDLVVNDPDNHPAGTFTMTISPGFNYEVSGNSVTPSPAYSGELPVQVQVGDGAALSEPFTLRLQVTQENVRPVINGQVDISTPEDQTFTITTAHLTVTDPDDKYPDKFIVKVGEGVNYTVSGTTITPAINYSGMLSVPVMVNDSKSDSDPFPLQISVTPVNDVPVITGQSPDPILTGSGQAVAITISNLILTDPDNTYPTDFTLTVLPGDYYTVSGNTITPAAGFSGMLAVPVTANDPAASSTAFALNVSVAANSRPVITGQSPLSTQEDQPLAIALSNITVTDTDNSYPAGFSFTLAPGPNYSVSGDVISPAPDYAGPLVVPVTVNDGSSDSDPFDLQITVEGVNDAPVINGQVPLTVSENGTLALTLSHLMVADPDGQYPTGYTLSVLGGTNYSVSQNVITPGPGYNGTLIVPVFVNDGSASSELFEVSISVTPINDPPVIDNQRALEINEDTPITLSLQDLYVTDPDNTYPEGFTLAVQPGTNYSFTNTTVIPSTDFTGALTVNVIVSDGVSNSNTFPLQISVLPLNDAPVITGQNPVSTNEDVARTITFDDLIVSDPDNTYPTGFSLVVSAGANYTLSGNTVIPAPNYSGALNIQVQVSDGMIGSNIHNLSMVVVPVNDAPVITGQVPVQTAEDTPVAIQLSDLTVLDVDNAYPTGFMLAISAGTNYSVSGSTVTPATDFNGTLNVAIMVHDGVANSPSFAFQIQVGNANDPPVITGQVAVNTNEETPVALALSHFTVFDPDNAFPAGFSLIVSPGVNYTVSGQTITPAVNFTGVLTIPVRVNDGINNSASFDFKLQVNQINDAPSFAAIPNQQVPENSPVKTVTITGISKGPMEDNQLLTFVATSGNTAIIENPVIQYNGTAATAVLSYVVKPNTSGVVTITVVAIDNGSNVAPNQNSYTSSFQVEVLEINSAPTLTAINNITLLEDAEQQNITLTGITAGPGETQSINVAVTVSKPDFFEMLEVAYTSPETTGLLQFKTKPNVFGAVQFSVTVTDNGSGISPHVNTITRTFTLQIQPVNDPPVFTSSPLTVAVINENYVYTITASDPDGDALTVSASMKPAWATLSGSNNGQATLSGVPPAAALGNAAVTLQVKDAAATVEQVFSIYVNVRPVISALTLATEEDTPLAFTTGVFTGAFTDANENAMASIQVTALPGSGRLLLSDAEVRPGDTISITSIPALTYVPNANYFGNDTFGWKAFDGYHLSAAAAAKISVVSVNDPPAIIFQNDTLRYEVNGEPAFLAPLADIIDPDDDSLTHASIGFSAGNFRPELDLLEFQNTANIRGNFNPQKGVVEFSGIASISEYRTALRSLRYVHLNTVDPLLTPKTVSFTLHDGETESGPKTKVIMLQYTFIEFEIPSGFTPNGDNANDTWIIDRPGGGLEEMDNAIISVYNKHGVLVYRRKGFDQPWDGTMHGELLPADSYFFTIDLQLRNKKTYKGIVTILR